jgi:hypothetical protein
MSVLGLIMSFPPYLRSAMVRFPLPFNTLKVTFSQRWTDGRTDRRTDRPTDGPTGGQTTRLQELLRAAKKCWEGSV